MAVNRYYRTTPYQSELYTPPVEFIGAALQQAQKQYDVNFAAAQGMKNKYIQSRVQDRAQANALQQSFESEIDAIVGKYQGDYSQASKDLYALQNKMAKEFNPGGKAAAIQQNLSLEQESLKRERERLAKGEITQEQFGALQGFYNQQGPTSLDENTGVYSQLKTLDLAKYYDVDKEFNEVLKGVKPRTIERAYRTGKRVNGEIESIVKKKQYIDPNEVAQAFTTKLQNDDGFKNYISQLAVLNGKDPDEVLNGVIGEYINNVIPLRTGVIEDSQKLDYEDDWKYQENYKFGLKKDLLRFKKSLDEEMAPGDMQSSFLTLAVDANSKNAQIPLTTKVSNSSQVYHSNPISKYLTGLFSGGEEKPTDVKQLLQTRSNPNYNYNRLQSIVDANPGRSNTDIINLYNQAVSKDSGSREYSRISYDAFKTTPLQQEEANRLIPGLTQGLYDVYVKNSKGQIVKLTEKEAREVGAKWQDPNSPLKARVGALGKARGDTGHVPSASTVMPDPDNKGNVYFVAPNRTDIKNFQESVLNKAFGFIQKPDMEEGEMFPISGNELAVGKKHYVNGEMQIVYYPVRKGKDGNIWTNYDDPFTTTDPVTGSKYYTTAAEMERKLLPDNVIKELYPHKTKSNAENEFFTDF